MPDIDYIFELQLQVQKLEQENLQLKAQLAAYEKAKFNREEAIAKERKRFEVLP